MSEENIAIVRAIFESGDTVNKEAILASLPEIVPTLFAPDAEWVEAPERIDAKTHRGHVGIIRSFEDWLGQWGSIEPSRSDSRTMATRFSQ